MFDFDMFQADVSVPCREVRTKALHEVALAAREYGLITYTFGRHVTSRYALSRNVFKPVFTLMMTTSVIFQMYLPVDTAQLGDFFSI